MKALLATAGLLTVLLVALLLGVCGDENERDTVRLNTIPASHDYDEGCWEGDCYGGERYDDGWADGGDGGRSGGHQGYGGGGGRSGDYDGGPGDDCRNACGNTIIVPTPGGGGREER